MANKPKAKRKFRVKAVKILKAETIQDEHVIVSETRIPATEPLPEILPEPDKPIEFTPEQEESGWAKWWNSLWS